jgi:hypothetical protein
MTLSRIALWAAVSTTIAIPTLMGSATAGGSCIGFKCHDRGFGNEGWITYERLHNKKLTRKQAYKFCKSKYVIADVMVFRLSKGGWECRIRRP